MAAKPSPRRRAQFQTPRRRLRVMHVTLTMLALLFLLKLNEVYFDIKTIREATASAGATRSQ